MLCAEQVSRLDSCYGKAPWSGNLVLRRADLTPSYGLLEGQALNYSVCTSCPHILSGTASYYTHPLWVGRPHVPNGRYKGNTPGWDLCCGP